MRLLQSNAMKADRLLTRILYDTKEDYRVLILQVRSTPEQQDWGDKVSIFCDWVKSNQGKEAAIAPARNTLDRLYCLCFLPSSKNKASRFLLLPVGTSVASLVSISWFIATPFVFVKVQALVDTCDEPRSLNIVQGVRFLQMKAHSTT